MAHGFGGQHYEGDFWTPKPEAMETSYKVEDGYAYCEDADQLQECLEAVDAAEAEPMEREVMKAKEDMKKNGEKSKFSIEGKKFIDVLEADESIAVIMQKKKERMEFIKMQVNAKKEEIQKQAEEMKEKKRAAQEVAAAPGASEGSAVSQEPQKEARKSG